MASKHVIKKCGVSKARKGKKTVEVEVDMLTKKQLQILLSSRSLDTSGSKSTLIHRLLEEDPHNSDMIIVINTDNLDDFIASLKNIRHVSITEMRRVITLLKTNFFGIANKVAFAAFCYFLWDAIGVKTMDERELLISNLESSRPSRFDADSLPVGSISKIKGGSRDLRDEICYLHLEQENLCRTMNQDPAIPIPKYYQLLSPFIHNDEPSISELIPLLMGLYSSGAIDSTLHCGATGGQRSLVWSLEVKFDNWTTSRPWINTIYEGVMDPLV